MLDKIYGIDYQTWVCGGVGKSKLAPMEMRTVLFYRESEMLETIANLKEDCHVSNIKPFTTLIIREEYKI